MKNIIPILIPALMSLLIACSGSPESKTEAAALPVGIEPVRTEQVQVPVHTSGVLAPVAQMKLAFKTGGIVQKISAEEGDRVKKGQLLAQLDLSEINARVSQAESAFEKVQRDFRRVEKLYGDSVATEEQFQNAQTGMDLALAELQVARFNREHSMIKAPADGSILMRLSESNELISPGQPILIFGVSGEEWLVRVGVTGRDLLKLQPGDSARVTFDAYPGETFRARVSEIAGAAHPANGTFEVELILRNPNVPLKSGFIATADIFPSRTEKYYIIPIEALVEADEESAYVFVPSDKEGAVKKVPVRIAFVYGDRVAVREGLEGVDQVITSGSAYLTESSRIEVRK